MLDGLQLGRYRLIERLAIGGMAEIYLAEQEANTGDSRSVVIKTMLPQFTQDEAMRTMLQDEARIGFKLQHRNIVQILDVGDEQDLLYIAMEYVEGANLAQLSELAASSGSARQDVGLVAYIGLEVLAALDYAHNRRENDRSLGIVHRDVSPQNILVSTAGEVKLSDFGIALARDRITKTTMGAVKGKLAYMPPEQATAESIGPSADVFSTAAVLYELLTGTGPYGATTDIEILRSIERGAIGRVAEERPDLPEKLAHAIDAALTATPEARPTAGEFRELLEPFAAPASQAEKALQKQAIAARAYLTSQSKHQRRFEGALLGQATHGASTVNIVPTVKARKDVQPRSKVGVSLLGYGFVAVLAVFAFIAARALWPEKDTASQPTTASLSILDAAPSILDAAPGILDAAPSILATDAAVPFDAGTLERAAPTKEKRSPAKEKKGTLTITSFPWAEVEVDGKKVGNTPIRLLRLRPGRHKVRLSNPQSGKRVRRTVTIKPGKNASLRIEL